jgi:hypothetical protein
MTRKKSVNWKVPSFCRVICKLQIDNKAKEKMINIIFMKNRKLLYARRRVKFCKALGN